MHFLLRGPFSEVEQKTSWLKLLSFCHYLLLSKFSIYFTWLNLSCTFHSRTPIKKQKNKKNKKKWWQNTFSETCQNKVLSPIFNIVKFSLRPKNECGALVAFKLCGIKYLKMEGMTYQQA